MEGTEFTEALIGRRRRYSEQIKNQDRGASCTLGLGESKSGIQRERVRVF